MFVRQKPWVVKCPKCKKEAIVHPNSDVYGLDWFKKCSKCDEIMIKTNNPSFTSRMKLALYQKL